MRTRLERLEGNRTGTFDAPRIKDESCASNSWSNHGACSSIIKQEPASIDVAAHIRNKFGIKQEVKRNEVARKRRHITAEESDGEIEVIASRQVKRPRSRLQGTLQTARECRPSSIATTQSNNSSSHLKYEGIGSTGANLPPKSSYATYNPTKRRLDAMDSRCVGRVPQVRPLGDRRYGRNEVSGIGFTNSKRGRITMAGHPSQARPPTASGVDAADHHVSRSNAQPSITRVARVHPAEVNTERERRNERHCGFSKLLDWQLEESWKRLEDQMGFQRTELDKRIKQAGMQLERELEVRLPQWEQQLRQANQRLEQQLEAQRPQFEEHMRQTKLRLDRELDAASRILDQRMEQEILRLEELTGR